MNPIYEKLSRISFLSKRYTLKFLFIAFLGIHVPLIGLIIFIVAKPDSVSKFAVLMLTLGLTLGATAVTLYILNGLLSPLRKSRQALHEYLTTRKTPSLPTHFEDEAGLLMQNIQFTVTELNDLLEEKKDLTSLLSHDLRIPIQNVKTFAELLQKNPEDAVMVKDMAGMILESAQEQRNLLNTILEILRQDYLFFNADHNEKSNVEKLVAESLLTFGSMAETKDIKLVTDLKYKGTVEVQPELFKQVLKNLVSNAIKFSYPSTEVNISVYQQHSHTYIDIRDSGMGFEPEVAERLFDRFTRNGRKGTAGEPTTGIGLYLSRKIIKHQKGDLFGYSDGVGKGSTFTICLN